MQILTSLVLLAATFAQPTSDSPLAPPPDGPRHADPTYHVLINATVHPAPGEVIEMGAVAIKDGRIIQVHRPDDGAAFSHEGARVWDCEGMHIYPGFIDAYVEVEAPAPTGDPAALHWNERVIPQRRATDGEGLSSRDAETLRKMGFVAAGIAPGDGIFRGRAGVVSLADGYDDDSQGEVPVYRDDVYHAISFSAGGFRGGYPNSQMGAIALIRQTLSDADWQASRSGDRAANALDALDRDRPIVFQTRDELEALRAAKIAREFGREMIIVGSGDEYKRLDAIVADGHAFILPIDFPDAPTVDSIGAEDGVELATLMAWEHAPYNPRRLDEAGVDIALTTAEGRSSFMTNLRTAIEHGLAEDRALAMLTTKPAGLLGVDAQLGTIDERKIASLIVADGPIFEKKTKVRDVWVDGRRHQINAAPEADISGTWSVTMDGAPDGTTIRIASGNKITLTKADLDEPLKARSVKRNANMFSFVVDDPEGGVAILVSAVVEGDDMAGTLRTAVGDTLAWSATRTEVGEEDDEPEAEGDDARDPITGRWSLTAYNEDMFGPQGVPFTLDVSRDDGDLEVVFEAEPVEAEVTDASFDDGVLQLTLRDSQDSTYELTMMILGDTAQGQTEFVDVGVIAEVEGTRESMQVAEREAPEDDAMPELPGYPFGPYALTEQPEQRSVVFVNATVWTSGPEGIIENGYVAIENGRITRVGKGPVSTNGLVDVIDLEGRHITPGIIDCHSHTGISRGTNESGQAVTAEVRIQDVTDPDTVNWYRQLAGGVTAVNNLHGSANPIGGQSQTNKVRWGVARPDDMHMEGAVPGIKFALGENVKQSNWSNPSGRYPQTRMGVETLIRDRFIAAREYAIARNGYENDPNDVAAGARQEGDAQTNQTYVAQLRDDDQIEAVSAFGISSFTTEEASIPRRDLELEALAEILAGERLIHCHSYRQDEILMLCRVAEEFGFTIGSFQHVLEGYKVAEAIKENALGGSSFSDWWAYKVEVQDAIPHNGAIMHDVGVTVSFNSDSNELARRLNTEAAKAVRYGGVEPAEALKFVTLNPAIQLGVDDRIGSIEVGKDADLAIWSGNPLSTMTICEETWVDGRQYFSLETDAEHRERNAAERTRLIQKILSKDDNERGGSMGSGGRGAGRALLQLDEGRMTVADWRRMQTIEAIKRHNLDLIQRGLNPADHRCGDCGTSLSDLYANEH